MANHFERDLATRLGQRHSLVPGIVDQVELIEPLDHVGNRGATDRQLVGELLGGDGWLALAKPVDRLEVVLHGVGNVLGCWRIDRHAPRSGHCRQRTRCHHPDQPEAVLSNQDSTLGPLTWHPPFPTPFRYHSKTASAYRRKRPSSVTASAWSSTHRPGAPSRPTR